MSTAYGRAVVHKTPTTADILDMMDAFGSRLSPSTAGVVPAGLNVRSHAGEWVSTDEVLGEWMTFVELFVGHLLAKFVSVPKEVKILWMWALIVSTCAMDR